MNQRTLTKEYHFSGKGLHTGKFANMTVCPAPVDTGIVFQRVDLKGEPKVQALAENVSSTSRSTLISCGKASIGTIEHLLSALTGLGIDNALIKIDGPEVPILDGSALKYVQEMGPDGSVEQDSPRKWLEIDGPLEYTDRKSDSVIRIEPAEDYEAEVTIDFNSKVLGVQTVKWGQDIDYPSQIAPCRTFCFLHEIQLLATLGLVKGGDVENAIVVVEKPVGERTLAMLARRFGQPLLTVTPDGYLSNLTLRFPDECGRHKLLDLIGDFRLCGGFLKARVTAYKPGHRLNTEAAKLIRKHIK